MFTLQALLKLNKHSKNIMQAATQQSEITRSRLVDVSLLLLICMTYLISPSKAWMPDVRPDLQSSKYCNRKIAYHGIYV